MFEIFDNGQGLPVPLPDNSGFRNEPIRMDAIEILNGIPAYILAFGKVFPEVKRGAPITFDMFGRAIAEFEFTLTFANAPIDRFARGQHNTMTDAEKRGALVFFGEGKCVTCHATQGQVERDVQRLRESRRRHPATRAAVRQVDEQHDL